MLNCAAKLFSGWTCFDDHHHHHHRNGQRGKTKELLIQGRLVVFPFLLRKRKTFFARFNAFPLASGGRIKTQARESSLKALLLYSSPAPLNSTNNIEPGQKDQYSKEHFPQPSWNVNAYVLEINYIELSRPPSSSPIFPISAVHSHWAIFGEGWFYFHPFMCIFSFSYWFLQGVLPTFYELLRNALVDNDFRGRKDSETNECAPIARSRASTRVKAGSHHQGRTMVKGGQERFYCIRWQEILSYRFYCTTVRPVFGALQ